MRNGNHRRVAWLVGCAITLTIGGCDNRKGTMTPASGFKTENVKLVWKQATNEWKVQLNGGGEMNPNAAKTTINKGDGPAIFIVDVAGQGATFRNPGGLSVWTGPKTNPAPPGVNSTQILGPVITSNGKMVFFDLNDGPAQTLNYAIHFTNKPSVDPIIDNGGGKEF